MNPRVKGFITKLERGEEFCGVCGKDITNAPDCNHSRLFATIAYNSHYTSYNGRGDSILYVDTLYTQRIGVEYLLYLDELSSLPCMDRPSYGLLGMKQQRIDQLKQELSDERARAKRKD